MGWKVGLTVDSPQHLELVLRDLTRLLPDLPAGTVLWAEHHPGPGTELPPDGLHAVA